MRFSKRTFAAFMRALIATTPVVGRRRVARISLAATGLIRQPPRVVSGRLRENLTAMFPDADVDALVRAVTKNAARARVVDKYVLPATPHVELERNTVWEDDAALRDALDSGRGVVVVSLHYGRFWLVPTVLSRRGHVVTAFQRGDGRLPVAADALSGGTLNSQSLSSPLKAARILKKGGVVGVLLDVGAIEKPVVVDFLGRPTALPSSPISLARAADAVVVALLAVASAEDPERVTIRTAAVVDPRELPSDEADADTMRRIAGPLESLVRADPSQWYGVLGAHRRWVDS